MLDGALELLRVGATDGINLLGVLPEVESRHGPHTFPLHQLGGLSGGVTHHLDEDGIGVTVGHVIELRSHDLTGAAPGGGVVHNNQLTLLGFGNNLYSKPIVPNITPSGR